MCVSRPNLLNALHLRLTRSSISAAFAAYLCTFLHSIAATLLETGDGRGILLCGNSKREQRVGVARVKLLCAGWIAMDIPGLLRLAPVEIGGKLSPGIIVRFLPIIQRNPGRSFSSSKSFIFSNLWVSVRVVWVDGIDDEGLDRAFSGRVWLDSSGGDVW